MLKFLQKRISTAHIYQTNRRGPRLWNASLFMYPSKMFATLRIKTRPRPIARSLHSSLKKGPSPPKDSMLKTSNLKRIPQSIPTHPLMTFQSCFISRIARILGKRKNSPWNPNGTPAPPGPMPSEASYICAWPATPYRSCFFESLERLRSQALLWSISTGGASRIQLRIRRIRHASPHCS